MPRKSDLDRWNDLERWRGEVTQHLNDITERLDEWGDRFEKALTQHAADDAAKFDKLDTRVAVTEKIQSKLAGKVGIVAGLIGAVAAASIDAAMRKWIG